MIVLHAGLVGDQLHLWGECALDGVELAPRRRGAKRKTPILRHLPTAAPPTQLIEALQPILTNDTPVASEVEPLNVWMPTINDVSLPSHPLIGDSMYGDGKHNKFFRERFGIERLCLASREIALKHPDGTRELRIVAPLAEDFAAVCRKLGWPFE